MELELCLTEEEMERIDYILEQYKTVGSLKKEVLFYILENFHAHRTELYQKRQQQLEEEAKKKKQIREKLRESCTCSSCQGACMVKPGVFLPGEAEKVAEYLGVSLKELFETKLTVDWIEEDVYYLAPSVVGRTPGKVSPFDPRGRCVFLQKGRCSIHAVKPFECRDATCHDDYDIALKRKQKIAKAWQGEHQDQVAGLLGGKPKQAAPTAEDALKLMQTGLSNLFKGS